MDHATIAGLMQAIAPVVRQFLGEQLSPIMLRLQALEARLAVAPEMGPCGKDGMSLLDALTDAEGYLCLTRSDGTLLRPGRVVGRDGLPGRGIEKAEVAGGHLRLVYSDDTIHDAGEVVGPPGPPGDSIKGDPGDPGRDGMDGAVGRSIEKAEVVANRLMLFYSDGAAQDAGDVRGPCGGQGSPGDSIKGDPGQDGVGIADIIVAGDTRRLKLTNGAELDLGRVVGRDGTDGVGIEDIQKSNDGHAIALLTDGRRIDLGRVEANDGSDGAPGRDGADGQPGVGIVRFLTEGPAGIVEYSDGRKESIGRVVGLDGADGAPGPQGERGLAGLPGDIGPIGPQGEKGLTGDAGRDGMDGPIGPRGEKGDPGEPGMRGEAGVGERGEMGAPGRDGLPGAPGTDGVGILGVSETADGRLSVELTDETLFVTTRSIFGRDGRDGAQGERGEKGLDGTDGTPGEQGPPGPVGEKGLDGAVGPTGPQGERGEKGLDGAVGPTGPQGERGERGLDGAPGPMGESGQRGEKGDPGRDGVDGVVGSRGEKGDQGERGEPGPTGRDGADGKDVDPEFVRSLVAKAVADIPPAPSGKDGKDGEQGPAGRDGKDADPEFIKAMVTEAVATTPLPKDGRDGEQGPEGRPGRDGSDADATKAVAELHDRINALREWTQGEISDAVTRAMASADATIHSALATVPRSHMVNADGDLVCVHRDGTTEIIGHVRGENGKDGETPPGLDRLAIEDGNLIQHMTDGRAIKVGVVVGKDGRDGKDGEPGMGFDDMEAKFDGERTLTLRWEKDGRVVERTFTMAVPLYRGTWKSDQTYGVGDITTFSGGMWVCTQPTSMKPGEGDEAKTGWRLATKAPRNGKSAYDIWRSLGNTGTEREFIASLKGPEGKPGPVGPSGRDRT